MLTPDFMPVLSAGAHDNPKEGACVMEMVSFLAGEDWSDRPACTHPVLAEMARSVNDRLPDDERQKILPLMGRLFGTAETGTDRERHVLRVRLAAWCARQVLDLAPDRGVALAAVVAAEGWCDGLVTAAECRAAADAANAANAANAAYAANAANAANAAYAANAAANAAYAANAANAASLLPLLSGLIDEYDRLTGRTEHRQISEADHHQLADLLAV